MRMLLLLLQDGAREGRFNAKAAASAAAITSDRKEDACGSCATSTNCVTAISFDKNQRRLVLCTNSGAVTVWNFNNGSLLRRCAVTQGAQMRASPSNSDTFLSRRQSEVNLRGAGRAQLQALKASPHTVSAPEGCKCPAVALTPACLPTVGLSTTKSRWRCARCCLHGMRSAAATWCMRPAGMPRFELALACPVHACN